MEFLVRCFEKTRREREREREIDRERGMISGVFIREMMKII